MHRAACALYVAATLCVALVARRPEGSRAAGYVAVHLVLTALMLTDWATGQGDTRATLVAGVLARLAAAVSPAFTSHDMQRYLLDGATVAAGLDPYRLPAGAPELAALRIAWPHAPEHLDYTTLYPPGALGMFALCAALGPHIAPVLWKSAATAASVATAILGARMLRESSSERHIALLALSPLLVLEGGVGAHLDAFSALSITVAVLWVRSGRAGAAGLALGAGALVRFLPALALVPLARSLGARRSVALVAPAAATVALGYLVAWAAGLESFGSLWEFTRKWRFGSPLFQATEGLLPGPWPTVAAAAVAAAALVLSVHLAAKGREAGALTAALASPLVAGPIVFPWYLSSLVPTVAAAPSAAILVWLSAHPLTYELIDRFDATGEWRPASWPLWAVAGAVFAGAAIDIARKRAARDRPRR